MTATDRMTTREVQAYLGCGYGKALSLMGGAIPAARFGRSYTASRADVLAYAKASTRTDKGARKRGRGRNRPT